MPATSVFWVNANNTARFLQSYRNIAYAAKLPEVDDPEVDILDLVLRWLDSDKSGCWFMILDNADSTAPFFGPRDKPKFGGSDSTSDPQPLAAYLPTNQRGSLLITSRNEGTALNLVGNKRHVLTVEIMPIEETTRLLCNKLDEDHRDKDALSDLIKELDSIPLAITQAAAYISAKSPRLTISRYLQPLRHSEANSTSLLSQDEVDLRRDPSVPNPVIRTWSLSLAQVKKENPAAAQLLSQMCMLDRQGIPDFLFCEDGQLSLSFEENIGTLIQFSFVKEAQELGTFYIHRLVQLVTKAWLNSNGGPGKIQADVLDLILQHHPRTVCGNLNKCQILAPHADTVLNYDYISQQSLSRLGRLLRVSACVLLVYDKPDVALKRLQRAIETEKSLADPDQSAIVEDIHHIANTYVKQDQLDEAEKYYAQAIETGITQLGIDHIDTLWTKNSLARDVYNRNGRYTKAGSRSS